MKPLRKKRLESAMMRGFANLIMKRRAKDERLGLVSVTGVDLAADLSSAIIRVSLFGTEEENRETWQGLAANLAFFQSQIGKDLRLRYTPRMEYALDTSIAEGDRILELIERERPPEESLRESSTESSKESSTESSKESSTEFAGESMKESRSEAAPSESEAASESPRPAADGD